MRNAAYDEIWPRRRVLAACSEVRVALLPRRCSRETPGSGLAAGTLARAPLPRGSRQSGSRGPGRRETTPRVPGVEKSQKVTSWEVGKAPPPPPLPAKKKLKGAKDKFTTFQMP